MKKLTTELIGAESGPFFLYDLDLLRSRIHRQREQSSQRLCFKVKNNPNPHLLSELKNEIEEFLIESDVEQNLLLALGVRSEQIVKYQRTEANDESLDISRDVSHWVMECGVYGAEVLARKKADWGNDILIVHGGFQHLGRSYLCSHERAVEVFREKSALSEPQSEFNISGSLCLGQDTLHPRILASESIRRGDWIVFSNSGILGVTAGAPYFIGQGLAREFIFKNGQMKEVTLRQFRLYHDSFSAKGP